MENKPYTILIIIFSVVCGLISKDYFLETTNSIMILLVSIGYLLINIYGLIKQIHMSKRRDDL